MLKKRNGTQRRTDSSGNDDWSESGAERANERECAHCSKPLFGFVSPNDGYSSCPLLLLFLSSFFSVEFASLVVVNLYIYCLSPSVSFVFSFLSSEAYCAAARHPLL